MALEVVVVATLLSSAHGLSPILTGLACAFLVKFSFNVSLLHQGCIDIGHGIRLLVYQMSRRWQQALQILCGRVITVRRSPVETSFHALTMLSL
ncbi:hypothetical protein PTKIN_Ptkin04bG0209000 [Pterospermum kingtungense]